MLRVIFRIFFAGILLQIVLADTFADQCLEKHNEYLALHSAPPLELNSGVQAWAQEWANHLAQTDTFQHRPNNQYGENIYVASGSRSINGGTPVTAWYNEVRYYDWNNPGFNMRTGHFTQVVWKNSQQLGCAQARRGNKIYVVANYSPPGNVNGQYEQNVLAN